MPTPVTGSSFVKDRMDANGKRALDMDPSQADHLTVFDKQEVGMYFLPVTDSQPVQKGPAAPPQAGGGAKKFGNFTLVDRIQVCIHNNRSRRIHPPFDV